MFLRSSDTISGNEGKATANIAGNILDLFMLKKLEATMEKFKNEKRFLGKRAAGHKSSGWLGKGSMTMYYVTSTFRKLMRDYAKTGKDFYFDMTVTNDDPASSVGKQTIVLYNCNLDSILLTILDAEGDSLEEDVDFTFEDWDILDEFGNPIV